MKKLIVARSAGFCFGVSRSVRMAEELLDSGAKCSSLGELIHNADVVGALSARGLRLIKSPSEAHAGEKVLIRAHGIARSVQQELERSGAEIVDATCPKVKHIHNIVSEATAEGRFVIIIGMRRHPEVEGICGWCGEHMVFETAAELETWLNQNPDFWDKPLSVVVQTTQTHGNFTECCNILKKRCTNLKISDTICTATSARQQEAEKLASECDAMVVIGGKHSANSLHLAQICSEHCGWVQFIEKCDELDMDKVTDADTIGLTAGASTPAWIIKEVRNKMSDEIKVEESAVEAEKSFDEMLEETLKTIYNGDKVTGHVVAITGTEISVDLGTKYSGFIPTSEFTDDGVKVEDVVKVGDTIEAVVVRVNDVEGTVMLSKKRLDAAKSWNEIEVGKKYNGVVKSLTSYGAFVDIGGIDGMVHVSELSWSRIKQPSEVLSVGDEVEVYVISFDKEKRKISLGYKDPNGNPWTVFTNTYGVGSVAKVTIVKLMPFGAFAEVLPGVDGLIHISQIANRRIGKPEDVLAVGDVVDAKITAIDEEKHKISLSIRALSEPERAPIEEVEEEELEPAEDALVYEVSATGEASGIVPEEE